jgi:hypothetical protein
MRSTRPSARICAIRGVSVSLRLLSAPGPENDQDGRIGRDKFGTRKNSEPQRHRGTWPTVRPEPRLTCVHPCLSVAFCVFSVTAMGCTAHFPDRSRNEFPFDFASFRVFRGHPFSACRFSVPEVENENVHERRENARNKTRRFFAAREERSCSHFTRSTTRETGARRLRSGTGFSAAARVRSR